MALPLSDREEIIVTNDDVNLLNELRLSLLSNFPRTWVLLYNDSNEKIYGIEVLNPSGGQVEKDKDGLIREYIEKFMLERAN